VANAANDRGLGRLAAIFARLSPRRPGDRDPLQKQIEAVRAGQGHGRVTQKSEIFPPGASLRRMSSGRDGVSRRRKRRRRSLPSLVFKKKGRGQKTASRNETVFKKQSHAGLCRRLFLFLLGLLFLLLGLLGFAFGLLLFGGFLLGGFFG